MTEVADGNSIRMSAPQEVLPPDGPEGFGSGSNLSACSNATLDRPVNCTADQAKEADIPCGDEVIASQTGIKPGDSVAHIDKETSSLKRVEGEVVEEVAKAGESIPLLDVQDVKGSAGEERVEPAPIEENHVKVDASETTPARKNNSNVEAMAVQMPVIEDLKADEKATGKERSTGEAEMDGRQNTGTGNIGVEASLKAKTQEEDQETLPSAAITQDEGQQANGNSEVVQEEKKVEEIGTVTDADKASTNLPCEVDEEVRNQPDDLTDRIANEMANKLTEDMAFEMADEVAGRLREEMAEKMTDEMADRMADEMADRMADEMVDRMADEMADKMADEMADKMAAEMADELADEMADEVIEGQYGMGEEGQGNENLEVEETNEVEDMEEEEEVEEDGQDPIDDNGEGTVDEQMAFVEELERFFKQRKLEYKAPKFYGLELNVLKLWRVVTRLGGYEHVTVSKLWRTVGEEFKPPKTCTTISWSFRGFYEKALLDYERFKTGIPVPGSSQRGGQIDGPYLGDNQGTVSPATPSSQPTAGGVSGSGRARRDAAARAMQGWHSQRMGNGDAKEPNSKEKLSGGKHVKKEKKLTNIGGNGLKRKGTTTVLERAVKAVRAKGRPRLHEESPPSISAVVNTGKRSIKQQDSMRRPVKVPKLDGVGGFDPPIVDEGPKADWVKINVHKHLDCFEIYALVPGLAREEVRIQCEPGGRLVIAGMPEDPENPWGVTPFRKVISLPSRIDAHQTSAVVTLYGQLYVRVPIAEDKST